MTKSLDEVTLEALQHRVLEELEAQQRLQQELVLALESERNLRLENDLLWAYLHRKHPSRVKDAKRLLKRLKQGSNLSSELQDGSVSSAGKKRTMRQRIGSLPGVHRVYHGLKNLGK